MNEAIKPILAVGTAVCMAFSFLLLSCAAGPDAQRHENASLAATLKLRNVYTQGPIRVQIEFSLKNLSDKSMRLLKWGTPFEGRFTDDMFEVVVNGKPVPYTGMMIKRGAPRESDYITIEAHGTLTTRVAIEDGYALTTTGHYTVRYRHAFITVRENGTDTAAALRCAGIAFDLI